MRILVCIAALVLTQAAYAKFDRTIDGKTKVWHNLAQRRVQPTWSGDRDEKGYATGKGTLTWFRVDRNWQTGSLLPESKYIRVAQYKGKMVKGKLEGTVTTVDSKGKTLRAAFIDGIRTGEWAAGGSNSSRKSPSRERTSSHPPPVAAQLRTKPPQSPAEGPSSPAKLDRPAQPAGEPQVETKPDFQVAAGSNSSPTADSLRSLAMPPSSLRVAAAASPSPQPAAAPEQEEDVIAADKPATAEPASSSSAPSHSAQDDDARIVAALDSEFHAAVKANDISTIDRILADDFVLVHGAGQMVSKADLMKRARDKQASYDRREIEEGSQKVRVWRDTAVVTETLWVKGTENGQPVDQKLLLSETYARTPNGWRYVSGQASVP